MRVIVLGAAGQIGRLTTARALIAGHDVTAFARGTGRLADVAWAQSSRVSVIEGDLRDGRAVSDAVAGHDAVVAAFGAPLTLANVVRVPDLCTVATKHVLSAMAAHAVRRLVLVSSIGVGDARSSGRPAFRYVIRPLLLGRIFADRERQEALVTESNTDWTIVRPAELKDGPTVYDYRVLGDPRGQCVTRIARADVADFLVRSVESKAHIRQKVILTS